MTQAEDARALPRRRAIVVTLDACGVGALPDAASYGDDGADTLRHLADLVGGLRLPTLASLGLAVTGSAPIEGLGDGRAPSAIHGRLAPDGPGKDSTSGHWELMGAGPTRPMPAYPDGFPRQVVARLERITGARFCCNAPYNGLEALADFGEHHLRSGELILYTSQDSVLQVAAHVDRMPVAALVATCGLIREAMTGEHAVGRVIARPFAGDVGAFTRVEGRRDLSLQPGPSVLDRLGEAGVPVHGVGKIGDLFAGRGIAERHEAHGNAAAIATTTELIASLGAGLIFTNLIDTDQLYAHRKDVEGFHAALRDIDAAVATWLGLLEAGDLLVLTADHGCDPAAGHSDHTREYVPLLATGPGIAAARHDGAMADVGATVHRWLTGREPSGLPGRPFA